MPPRSRQRAFPSHSVTAVLVCHDGVTWLPDCLDGLTGQTRPPQQVVAVDTGSTDGSAELVAATLGASTVVQQPRTAGLGCAVDAGLRAFPDRALAGPGGREPTAWVWILHDDCAPAPDALAQLLARAENTPSAAAVVPKLLTWNGGHLLEVGATVDSSGSRDTGIDAREVDQGQHDSADAVLTGSTAGLLVRRDVWEALDGLDPAWPLMGDDVDLGWRINATGARVVAAPRAELRHAAALTAGKRKADAIRLTAGAAARLHGMQVVLANTSPWLVAPLAIRYFFEQLVRCIGALLLLRSPRRARDELVALAGLVTRPQVVARARRRRRATRSRPHREVRSLLAPPGRRWRHLGDRVGRTGSGHESAPGGGGTRRRRPVETGPVAAEAESFAVDDAGMLARLVRRPGVLMTLALVGIALVADRALLDGALSGGRLLPPAAGASDLWHLYLSDWHPVGLGSTTATPPGVALLALLATLLAGKVWLAVDVLMLGAVPLAGIAAYLGAGAVTRRRGLRAAAGIAYALTPPILSAVATGQLDVVVVAVLAPLVARSLTGAARSGSTPAAVRAGVLLAVACAFAPVAWPIALVAGAVAAAIGPLRAQVARAVAVAAFVPLLVLLPWTVDVVRTPRLLATGLGLVAPVPRPSGVDLLLLHSGGPAQPPIWVWAPVVALGLLSVLASRRSGRFAVLGYLAAVAAALVVSRRGFAVGAPVAVASAAIVAAAVVAVEAAPAALRRRAFGWRHAIAVILALAVTATTCVAGIHLLVRGSDRPLTAGKPSVLPVFVQAEAAAPTSPRILVVRPVGRAVSYALLRSPQGLRLGDADVTPADDAHDPARRALDTAVGDALAARPRAAAELARFGITLVVVHGADTGPVAGLHRTDRLTRVPATSSVVYRSEIPAGEAVVLSGADAGAAAGSGPPPLVHSHPLPASGGVVQTRIPSGRSPRLLVLAEPRSGAWRASIDGHALTATTAYGWAQAWPLPTTGGDLRVTRRTGSRSWWLDVEAALIVIVLLSCVPIARDDA